MPGIISRMTHMFVKIRLFKTLALTVLTCGCEFWELSISKKRRPSEYFLKNYLKEYIWTDERE